MSRTSCLPCALGAALVAVGVLAGAPVPALAQAPSAALPAVPLRTLLVAPPGTRAPASGGVVLQDLPPAMRSEGLREMLQPLLGQPITPAAVEAVVAEINRRLAPAGFYVASVPQQDVTGGTVRIEVRHGRVRSVEVQGPEAVADRAPSVAALRAGAADAAGLDEDLAWLERSLAGRRATARFTPGEAPGDMDVRIDIVEPPRLAVSSGFDNTGNETTGPRRLSAGVQVSQVLAPDDVLGFRLTTDPEFRHSQAAQVTYAVPLAWRHLAAVHLSATRLKAKLPAPLDLRGATETVGLRYEVPLRLRGEITDTLVAGFDYKRSDNNLLFSAMPVTDTVTHIGQFSLAYQALVRDTWGQTFGLLRGTWSPGGLFDRQDDASFDAARAGATARYRILQLQLDRQTPLPLGSWRSVANLQRASANLLGSEQLAAGGIGSVRGFNEGVAFGDDGWLWRNEWRLPPWQPLARPDVFAEFGLFVDAASVRSHVALAGEPPRRRLASAGVSLFLGLPRGLALDLHWGHRLRSDVPGQAAGGDRLHFALSGNWAF